MAGIFGAAKRGLGMLGKKKLTKRAKRNYDRRLNVWQRKDFPKRLKKETIDAAKSGGAAVVGWETARSLDKKISKGKKK